MKRWGVLGLLAGTVACTPPPSVQAVDAWLAAYAAKDADALAAHTWPGDRALVRACLEAQMTAPTSTLALALPPVPLEHEIIEIAEKEGEDRHVVLAKVTMKNPLPYQAERVNQVLKDIPKTRSQRRRYLSVREEGGWGVKLDLAAVIRRAEFVASFSRTVAKGELDAAERMLDTVPPPPDEANVQPKKDRLEATLRAELAEVRKRSATKTSSTAAQ